jgi:DNA-binding Lrp family transcriptional regulator
MDDGSIGEMDDIDRHILRILAEDPRLPYSNIADKLQDIGLEMSSEGVRYRVTNLFDSTSIQLLASPEQYGWNVLRLSITVENEPDAKQKVHEELSDMPIWLNCRVFGSFDLYAVATTSSLRDTDELISDIRELEYVDNIEYSLETERKTDIQNYLSF